ncbi:putative transferase CAF17 homolog, mitochondrial [Ostrea edulis]|uniref:putative transferase CAF17 homolog, mitochondrial n=1 Tax=Ostrea edulis TaxID=37623 RepID=UPI0024AF49AC|nr:putative transferase CAF17 homolog, mitochondrial [Ostrea edulis]
MRLLVPTCLRLIGKCPISILCRCHDVGSSSRDGISFTGKESRTYSKWRTWRLYNMRSRGMIRLKGADVVPFLQGMVTNDVSQLVGDGESMYTMMLNPQGRVLYDIIMYKQSPESDVPCILMECDNEVTKEIIKLFRKYKIRKKVDIAEVSDDFQTFAVLPSQEQSDRAWLPMKQGEITLCCPDPRLEAFGWRIVASDQSAVLAATESDCEIEVGEEREYHTQRYKTGLPEGIVDLPPGQCLPLESNLVFHNGVSFSKGCYIGQELTARSHHTGVIRKRLVPIQFDSVPEDVRSGDTIETADTKKNAGKYRNSLDKYGIGLIRLAEVKKRLVISTSSGHCHGVKAHIPSWWPQEGEVNVQQ